MNNPHSISKPYNKFLSNVYGWMALGLIITAFTSLLVALNPNLVFLIFGHKFVFYSLVIAKVGLVFYLSYNIDSMKSSTAKKLFITYSALMGASLSYIFFVYTASSIAFVFLMASAMFAAMALYGRYTDSDLSGMRAPLMMMLIGMIISTFVNMLFNSAAFSYILSLIGVMVFTLLIAYDSQKLKSLSENFDYFDEETSKYSIMGALTMYLNFINLFLYMLRLFGRRD